jgi:hypothetical protein
MCLQHICYGLNRTFLRWFTFRNFGMDFKHVLHA